MEPNIKEGKGGLRDLQTLYWLTKFLYGVSDVVDLVPLGVFTTQDVNRFTKAQDFLWTVRCHLHYLAGRPEERLTFDVQKTISERMTYAEREGIVVWAPEALFSLRDVGDLTRVSRGLEDQQKNAPFSAPGPSAIGNQGEGSRLTGTDHGGQRRRLPDGATKLLRILPKPKNMIDIHPQALRFISKSLNLIGHEFRQDPQANAVFMRVKTSRKEPEKARRLNEVGVFGKFVPDSGVLSHKCTDMYTPIQWMNTPSGR